MAQRAPFVEPGVGGLSAWRRHLAYGGYRTLLAAIKPAYLLRLWWRGRDEPLYRHAIGERMGTYESAPSSGYVWVHAVSLGETRAASALIDALRELRPDMRLLLTHGTATGREAGRSLLREGDQQAWLPYDAPRVVQRFFRHFRPLAGVLMETEVWPNLVHAAKRHGVPIVLANARLSERSRQRGSRVDALLRPAISELALVLAQTESDSRRLRDAGARHVIVSGNLKFDMTPDPQLLERGRAWRATLGRPVVLAAVTREGEEAMLLASWQAMKSQDGESAKPLLLVVPRHPQRFDEVSALLERAGLSTVKRSSWTDTPSPEALNADAWLGDSMGEMSLYYAASNVALLGGSFAPLGGQNLIEAAACGCPVVMGPHTYNFALAAELSLEAGASIRVADMSEGLTQALSIASDEKRGAQMSARAVSFAAEHRGAAQRMARQIESALAANQPIQANRDDART